MPFIPEKHLTHRCMKDRTLPGPASCSLEILRRLPDSLLVRLLIIGSGAGAPEVDLAPLCLPNVSGLGGAAAAAISTYSWHVANERNPGNMVTGWAAGDGTGHGYAYN